MIIDKNTYWYFNNKKKDTCKINKDVSNLIQHCFAAYDFINDDTKDYGIGWSKVNDSDSSIIENISFKNQKSSKYKCQNSWCYQVNEWFFCYLLF